MTPLPPGLHDMQDVCMSGVLVQIRDVDPAVRDRLKDKAAEKGLSLNSYLRELLSQDAAVPVRAEVIRRLRARGGVLPPGAPSSVEILREARAERDRQLTRSWEADDRR